MDDAVRLNSCAVAAQVISAANMNINRSKILFSWSMRNESGNADHGRDWRGQRYGADQRYFSLATRIAAEMGAQITKPIMSKKVLNGLLPDVRYPCYCWR